jgi:hypothetical protein
MLLALAFCLTVTIVLIVSLGAWVVDLRARSLQQEQDLRSLHGGLERVARDVLTLHQGDRRRVLAVAVNTLPNALARTADRAPEDATAADSSRASRTDREEEDPRSDSAPPSAPRRKIPPDVATLLVRSIAGGDRGPRDASTGAAVIWGAQKELVLVAEMLLAIDTRFREAWPEPPAIGHVLTALSDRILAGLELLSHERGGAPPPPPAADDDEPPPSSGSGGGPLTH